MARPSRIAFPGANCHVSVRMLGDAVGTGAAVSRQLRRRADRLEADPGLRRRMREAEGRLEDLRLAAKY